MKPEFCILIDDQTPTMKKLLSTIFILFLTFHAISQKTNTADSLRHVLTTTQNDSIKIATYKRFYPLYITSYPDSVKYYSNKGLRLAQKVKNVTAIADFSVLIAYVDFQQGKYDTALQTLDKALDEVGGNSEFLPSKLKLLNWKSAVYGVQRKTDKSREILNEIISLSDDFPLEQLSAYLLLGNVHFEELDYENALKYYQKVDSICISHEFKDSACNSALGNSGMVFFEIEQYEKSLEYHKKAQHNHITQGDTLMYIGVNDELSEVHLVNDEFEAAEKLLGEAIEYYQKNKYPKRELQSQRILRKVYMEWSNLKSALASLDRALLLSKQIKDTIQIAETYIDYGKVYSKQKNFLEAQKVTESALDLMNKPNQLEYRVSAMETLISIQKENNNFEKAFKLNLELQTLKDELSQLNDKKNISEIEAKYQSEKKEQEILFLTSQSELADAKAKNQRSWFIAGLLILAVAVLALYVLFRNKQQTNFKLRQLESAKSRFFANISHEFRTPLTLISGPVAHQLSKPKLSQEDKVDLGLIQRNADRLLSLVDQLLDLSKIEAGRRDLKLTKRPLDLFIEQIIESFEYQAKQKDIAFRSKINIEQEAWFDRDVIEKIITNLVSNAIKYSPKKGEISFSAILASNEKNVEIRVTNPNTDIPEKELPALFDRFYQNKTHNEGFGIGLSLVKELTNLSKGSVNAHKPSSETISFVVSIPIVASAFEKQDFSQPEDLQYDENIVLAPEMELLEEEENSLNGSLPLLLVVDDNEEIRLFIKSLLKRQYRILEAENGAEGVLKALEVIPDLVISDVMMPVKDGIYLSDHLKKDERTSHIPIILLTAKSGEDHELTGLRSGADVYMTKPFKEEKLRVVIEKLIASRTTIQEKFSQQVILKPKEIKLTPVDVKLLERIQYILDDQLTDPNFGAQSFSEEIGLSRMHLHRKLKALTGLSTSEFIRTQRLKLAAKLLRDGAANISEIGYTVGFNQPAYFSTAFKQHFGCSPSEFQ